MPTIGNRYVAVIRDFKNKLPELPERIIDPPEEDVLKEAEKLIRTALGLSPSKAKIKGLDNEDLMNSACDGYAIEVTVNGYEISICWEIISPLAKMRISNELEYNQIMEEHHRYSSFLTTGHINGFKKYARSRMDTTRAVEALDNQSFYSLVKCYIESVSN